MASTTYKIQWLPFVSKIMHQSVLVRPIKTMVFSCFARLWLLEPRRFQGFLVVFNIMHQSELVKPIKTCGFLMFSKIMAPKTYKIQ